MNVAGVGGRSFAKLVNIRDAKKPTSVSIKSVKYASKQTPGIRPVRQANTVEEMTALLTPPISGQFILLYSVTKKLGVQLRLCFKATGIANESCLGMMTKPSSWAVPDSFVTDN